MMKIALLMILATVGLAKHHHKHEIPKEDPSVERFECVPLCMAWLICNIFGTAPDCNVPSECNCNK